MRSGFDQQDLALLRAAPGRVAVALTVAATVAVRAVVKVVKVVATAAAAVKVF